MNNNFSSTRKWVEWFEIPPFGYGPSSIYVLPIFLVLPNHPCEHSSHILKKLFETCVCRMGEAYRQTKQSNQSSFQGPSQYFWGITKHKRKTCQTSNMGRFAKRVYRLQPLTVHAMRSILDVWQGSEYASTKCH